MDLACRKNRDCSGGGDGTWYPYADDIYSSLLNRSIDFIFSPLDGCSSFLVREITLSVIYRLNIKQSVSVFWRNEFLQSAQNRNAAPPCYRCL